MSEPRDDKPRTGVADRNGLTMEPSNASVRRVGLLLASYGDHRGEVHRVLLRGRFVLDVADSEWPRVVSELGEGEGEVHARAVLNAGGYLERAPSATAPLCRRLAAEDLQPRTAGQEGDDIRTRLGDGLRVDRGRRAA